MSKKIYETSVNISDEDKKVLKKVLLNHLLVYNYSLGLLYNNSEERFEKVSKLSSDFITEKDLLVLKTAVHNELYYQFKKFKRNVKVQKNITDIQYVTFTVNSYENTSFTVAEDKMSITLTGPETVLNLEKELPDVDGLNMLYFNISYSSIEDRFILNIYAS